MNAPVTSTSTSVSESAEPLAAPAPNSDPATSARDPEPPPVALADDALFLEHVAPPDHPERAERLLAVRAGLQRAGAASGARAVYLPLQVVDATDTQLARVHEPAHIEHLGLLAGRSGFLDADTFVSPCSVAAARRAAGAAVALVDALLAGPVRLGLALPRPPGHHALADRAMGFCLLNNVAVAAAHARAQGRNRVLVLDWDVHHGNGTEAIFYDDPSVLFVSLHQYPNYPGTGEADAVGRGAGRGFNVNLPLPAGATDSDYAAAFDRVVLPIVEQFAPDFALVSCGFDAHARDPLAQMELSARGFGDMTEALLETLDPRCPLGLLLEGGYHLDALTESADAVAAVLLNGHENGRPRPPRAVRPEQASALHQIQSVQQRFWRLS